ncbi:hypothetical protein FBUS_01154 [Fasciolopsis buskii]|uniref:Uncharacterized protein n=1 Tax=Fasciolopsis buskii TaxID=27845 RepID=A0A8E0RPQ7_9TREM|nr:hypothetical protein FBUS_01154 [Fasciolopsis buski]
MVPLIVLLTVDIDETCNLVDLFCRSRNSICTHSSGWTFSKRNAKSCTCKKDFVPVYQINLGYHECFPRIISSHGLCSACTGVGGVCFQIDDSRKNLTSCVCPHTWRPIERKYMKLASNQRISQSNFGHEDILCPRELGKICVFYPNDI